MQNKWNQKKFKLPSSFLIICHLVSIVFFCFGINTCLVVIWLSSLLCSSSLIESINSIVIMSIEFWLHSSRSPSLSLFRFSLSFSFLSFSSLLLFFSNNVNWILCVVHWIQCYTKEALLFSSLFISIYIEYVCSVLWCHERQYQVIWLIFHHGLNFHFFYSLHRMYSHCKHMSCITARWWWTFIAKNRNGFLCI